MNREGPLVRLYFMGDNSTFLVQKPHDQVAELFGG